jgi:putative transposase
MCLRFVFLLITRLAAWLRLSRREEMSKTAEILIMRHQLAVLQRRQPRCPKLTWADRALLVALLSVIPKARRHGLRLLVTPDTILRWHRGIVRRRWAARSMHGKTGRRSKIWSSVIAQPAQRFAQPAQRKNKPRSSGN